MTFLPGAETLMPMLFLMGPTASGKSGLAMHLAARFSLEILNADSVQVYRGMNIGAAKPTMADQGRTPHHLLDLVEPDEPFSAGRYRRQAMAVVASCHARRVIPAFVGGSGLYFRAVEQGLAPVPEISEEVVRRWRARGEEEGWASLHERLQQVDPLLADRISPTDAQRIL
ncbi:MAG: tRNA (adenosine(37)-N6)-dimethylallyltransferase MiaA, partial [Magnetococcales bacterium]|nr:tRNA (adenosine(37)-N6)-dimethylallyltransferase MiaA [Magnetococcales bacterium]